MRIFSVFLVGLFLIVSIACGESPPECDFDEDEGVSCSCDDGSTGIVECNEDGTANCICGDDDENDN